MWSRKEISICFSLSRGSWTNTGKREEEGTDVGVDMGLNIAETNYTMSSAQLALGWSHIDTLKFLLLYLDAIDTV